MEELTLEGATVILAPMRAEMLDELWEAANSKQIWEFTSSKIYSKEDMKVTIAKALAENKKGVQVPFVVIDKANGKVIGSTRYLDVANAQKTLEIGWTWYHPDYWRTRVNTETKFLLLKYAFENLKFNRVQFCTDLRNVRSQNAIERIGAQKEGILRKHKIIEDSYVRDTVVFSIISDEWLDVKASLQVKMKRDSLL